MSKLSVSKSPSSKGINQSYHNKYYVPENLTLVIVGSVDHKALLHTLQDQVEPSILSKGQPDLTNWKRYRSPLDLLNIDHG
jgi:Zn-dependent M16 (insulinase) family peptidase